MRVCLVSHGFPPHERTGVEVYTAALAAELARQGHAVEVLAPRRAPDLPELSLSRTLPLHIEHAHLAATDPNRPTYFD